MGEEARKARGAPIPSELLDQYVRFSLMGDGYLNGSLPVPSGLEEARRMRWTICVQKCMEIHQQICVAVGVDYSANPDNDFYTLFHREVNIRKARSRREEVEG